MAKYNSGTLYNSGALYNKLYVIGSAVLTGAGDIAADDGVRVVVGTTRGMQYNASLQYNSGINYNTLQGGFTGRGDFILYRHIVVGEATFTGAGDFSGGEGIRIAVGDALFSGEGYFSGGEGEVTKTYRVVYDLEFGPTTLGLNAKEKRARKVYLVVSKAANARMYVSYATTKNGPFTNEVPVGSGEALSRARKILPLAAGNPSGGYIYRIKVRGWGEATVHEIVFAVSERGAKSNVR